MCSIRGSSAKTVWTSKAVLSYRDRSCIAEKGTLVEHITVYEYSNTLLSKFNSSTRQCAGCEGSKVTFLALFLTLEVYISWRLDRGAPIILPAVLTVRCSLLMSVLVAEPNQTVIDGHRADSMMVE